MTEEPVREEPVREERMATRRRDGGRARIGAVGIGWWSAHVHIPTVEAMEGATVAALCDLEPGRLEVAGERFGIAARYTDMAEMLEREALDGVMVATPHVAHAAPAIAALEAGCHVLIEKPMATSTADARAIRDAARRAGREVLVPTGLNFTPYTAKARDWVRAGRIGTLQHAVCQMGSPLHDLFAGEPMAETEGHMFRPPASTWADPGRAGGYGWGQMSHSLAWLAHVTGLGFGTMMAMDVKSPSGVDFHDAAAARLTNGATVSISGASTVPKHVGMYTDQKLFGTEGMIAFSNLPARLELRRHDRDDEAVPLNDLEALYDGAAPVRLFARLCAGEAVHNASDAECGLRVTAALDALYRSAASGKAEEV